MTTMIQHHPDGTTLMSFAAASLAEPLAAVIAAHVSMCPRCRTEVADLEQFGTALLLSDAGGGRVNAPMRPADAAAPVGGARVHPADSLPAPVARAYGLSLDRVPWRRLGPGVWHHRLPLRQPREGDLRLLRIAAGRAMPDHGHGGAELTLVIEGAYRDVTGEYRRGDIQDVDEHTEHQPVVTASGDCICLIASDRPARFKSLLGRLMQPWTGM